MEFPSDYPKKPPKIYFISKVYHPNVSLKGEICVDLLKDNWSDIMDAESALECVQVNHCVFLGVIA